jgi:dTDP-4-amino-4,6-dideoxygalactose transaminase
MNGLVIPFTGIPKQYNNLRTEILDATDTVLQSGNLMSGEYTEQFETWLAKKNHSKFAITCHSGTQALEIIASYLNDEANSTVSVPAMTYVATANAWQRAGWTVTVADTNAYGLMDLESVHEEATVICPVGLYGHALSAKYQEWQNSKYSRTCVEDAAQHWLSRDCWRTGFAAAISFDPTKNFNNYSNGGAVITDSELLNAFARNWIRNRSYHISSSAQTGTNSRMSEVDCAQMMVKTRYIDAWQTRRGEIVRHWMERLSHSGIRSLIDTTNYRDHCYHKFVIDVDRRDQLHQALTDLGIETKIHYQNPIQDLNPYQDCAAPDMLGASYSLSRRCLSLPIYPELTDSETEYIIDSVISCV